ncbi:MAG: VanW family protein [Christensenellales bacterium]|jgi:vancomycin resistance protein YoaR
MARHQTSNHRAPARKTARRKKKNDRLAALRPPEKPNYLAIALWVVAGILVVTLAVIGYKSLYTETIAPHIWVDSIKISNLDYTSAKNVLETQRVKRLSDVKLTIRYDDQVWEYGWAELGADLKYDDIYEEIVAAAHSGNAFDRIMDRIKLARNPINLSLQVTWDADTVAPIVAAIAAQLDDPYVDATVAYNPHLDEKWVFTDDKDGFQVDQEAAVYNILMDLQDDLRADVTLDMRATDPAYTREYYEYSTQYKGVTFRTKVEGVEDRRWNVKLGISQFNGVIFWPGEVLSFNDLVGERSPERGYRDAPGIATDQSYEDTAGGGMCQVSTTVYNAVLLAGCTIEERHKHSIPSDYVLLGFDAMVWYGAKDLKVRNDSGYPMYFETSYYTEDGSDYIQVTIYRAPFTEEEGTPSLYHDIKARTAMPGYEDVPDMNHKHVTWEGERKTVVVAHQGFRVETYRVWSVGSEVRKKELLYEDRYEKIIGKIYYGVTPKGGTPGVDFIPGIG